MVMNETCGFAMSGTYGHECGKPAVMVGVKKTSLTTTGLYYARRCAECAKIRGGENSGILRFETLDPEKHVNQWNGTYQEKVFK